jgi:hypothetical protein
MKKLVHVGSMTLVLTALTGCSLLDRSTDNSAVPVESEPEPAPVAEVLEHTVLHKADYNLDDRETFKTFLAIDNLSDYQRELAQMSVEVPKPVDFSSQRVVALTMGSQPAGGYAVGVSSVAGYPDKVVVTVEMKSPGAGCINTSAISNPYEFALVPSALPVEFVETAVTQDC